MIKKNIFIIGSKGIPASYGGFESFVDRLTYYQKSNEICYHVSCAVEADNYPQKSEYEYNGARCFCIKWKKLGAARAVFYDIDALKACIKYIEKNEIENSIVYILACRIGPFIKRYVKKIHKLGGKVFVNPDGHEWKRAKWNALIRRYWKCSERLMVKQADLLICDSKAIEKYICREYKKYNPQTIFIAYGAETSVSDLPDDSEELASWYEDKEIQRKGYYLVVGRFVPENNYEVMIREFMKSKTKKDFVLITNVEHNQFYEELKIKTKFDEDERIKFVGTVYDAELLKKIRENAYGYFHGHEVGGTNPSLLEALGSTDLNLLLDVEFNREVAEDGAIYWTKQAGNLAKLIEWADSMQKSELDKLGEYAKARIKDNYSWDFIVDSYEKVFLQD